MREPLEPELDDLLRRASIGEVRALDSLLLEHMPMLEAFVRVQAGPQVRARESVSDLVQSVCLEVLRDADGFEYRGVAAFRSWLFRQVVHKIVSKHVFWRRERRDAGREAIAVDSTDDPLAIAYGSVISPSRVAIGRERLAQFETAFQRLPEDQREAIALHRVVGMPYPEVAATMERSEGAVRNLVHRGLARLSGWLDDPGGKS